MGMKKFGGRFAFEFFLETMHDSMIQGLKNYLGPITDNEMAGMIKKGKFPPLENFDFSVAADNIENIERISLVRLMEFIAEARPDLGMVIQETGEAGAMYMANLRAHLLNKVRQSAGKSEFKPKENMVMARCENCNKTWPVNKDEADKIKECPFCGVGVDEGQGETSGESQESAAKVEEED